MENDATLKEIEIKLEGHFRDDLVFQKSMDERWARMEPMIMAFEENKITKMVLDKKTNTLYLYSKRVLTIGGAIGLVYTFLKIVIPKLLR